MTCDVTYPGAVGGLVTEEIDSVGRGEAADGAAEQFLILMVSLVVFTRLPAVLADEIALGATVVRLVVYHHLLYTLVLVNSKMAASAHLPLSHMQFQPLITSPPSTEPSHPWLRHLTFDWLTDWC